VTQKVLVVGAGPAGSTAARLMAAAGRAVMIVSPAGKGEERHEILSPHGCRIFADAGLEELLADAAIARPCLGIRREWDGAAREREDFFLQPGGPGKIVARRALDAAMVGLALKAGATLVEGRLSRAQALDAGVEVEVRTRSGRIALRADHAIDASGRPASLARRLGARRIIDSKQAAWRSGTGPRSWPDGSAWIDIIGGPQCWSYEIDGHDGASERVRICRGRPEGAAGSGLDASSARLAPASGPSWAAVGDAAVSFDPLAGQGLAQAVASARAAVEEILRKPGGRPFLEEYAFRLDATWLHYAGMRSAALGARA
jgi:flavin-dependent dehydrogenase